MLARLNPTPYFPPYSGPYKVGTVDYEISTSDLDSPAPGLNDSISTVSFRIFYPTEHSSKPEKPVYWLPGPQREWLSAYARFLGAGNLFAEIFSYLPTLISRIRVPAIRDAPLRSSPAGSKRWPVMVFSHGLGGSRNSYCHLLGSLASHGVVVVAAEHRDGSAHHNRSPENLDARNEQFRIRLWELGLIHDALLKLDGGDAFSNIAAKEKTNTPQSSPSFRSALDLHGPGAITWAVHSFGAATMVQFVKSIFWQSDTRVPPEYRPLYKPSPKSRLASQVTATSPMVLLDLWTMPLRSNCTQWLWEKPLPCYSKEGTGGLNVLAIMSEEFFGWESILTYVRVALSNNPGGTPGNEISQGMHVRPGLRLFYLVKSAHLSQSDFGILFPWVTKKWLSADEPERTLKLNARAVLQMLRERGIPVAATSRIDREMEEEEDEGFVKIENEELGDAKVHDEDSTILASDGGVRGWISVRLTEEPSASEANGTTHVMERARSAGDSKAKI